MTKCNPMPMPLLENGKLDKDEQEEDANLTLYCWIISKLIYLTNSHLDLTYVVGILSRYMNQPKKTHMEGARHILRYLTGTHDYKILYQYKDKNDVHGFTMQIGLVIVRKRSLLQVIYLSLEEAWWHNVRKNSQLLHSTQLMLNIKQYLRMQIRRLGW
jgi:hypothetical protein